jgi:uncharacterized protein with PIN domain
MVVDTSALLAIFFNKKFGLWALDQIQAHADELQMSTVNYAEVLILPKTVRQGPPRRSASH